MYGTRWIAGLCALTLATFLSPSGAQGQDDVTPEVQKLGVWVGEWSYGNDTGSGTMEFEWFGKYLIKAQEKTPNGWDVVHFMWWDPDEEAYLWQRYWSSGLMDRGQGWLEGDTWTFIFAGNPQNVRRMTIVMDGPEDFTFEWARSQHGGSWEVTSGGKTTKVR